jgi:FAD/FMN-containing dehydrogenase
VTWLKKDLLFQSPPISVVPQTPICFYSFSTSLSVKRIEEAQRHIEKWKKQFPLRYSQTISFLDSASVFLLRAEADLAHQRHFRGLAKSLEKAGYTAFRDHSAYQTKYWTDGNLRKMIKLCFDPNGIISPGRYGL